MDLGLSTRFSRGLSVDAVHTGQQVSLEPLSQKFAPAIFRGFTEEISALMVPNPSRDIGGTRSFIQAAIADSTAGVSMHYVILDKESEDFLGCTALHYGLPPELGIWLKKEAHGRGLARDAIICLIRTAQSQLGCDSFSYPTDVRNEASIKLAQSLGGKELRDGHSLPVHRGGLNLRWFIIEANRIP